MEKRPTFDLTKKKQQPIMKNQTKNENCNVKTNKQQQKKPQMLRNETCVIHAYVFSMCVCVSV